MTCSMGMLVARGVLIGLCGMVLGVGASFILLMCFVGDVVWLQHAALHTPKSGSRSTRHLPTKVRSALPATGRETWSVYICQLSQNVSLFLLN